MNGKTLAEARCSLTCLPSSVMAANLMVSIASAVIIGSAVTVRRAAYSCVGPAVLSAARVEHGLLMDGLTRAGLSADMGTLAVKGPDGRGNLTVTALTWRGV